MLDGVIDSAQRLFRLSYALESVRHAVAVTQVLKGRSSLSCDRFGILGPTADSVSSGQSHKREGASPPIPARPSKFDGSLEVFDGVFNLA